MLYWNVTAAGFDQLLSSTTRYAQICQVDGRDDRSVRGDDCSVSPLRRSGAANLRRFGWVWLQKAFFLRGNTVIF